MDKSDWTVALARVKKRVVDGLIVTPANFALNILLFCIFNNATINLDSLFFSELIVAVIIIFAIIFIVTTAKVWLFDWWATCTFPDIDISLNWFSSKVFNSELQSSQFNRVPLSKFIVHGIFILTLHVPDNDEHHVRSVLLVAGATKGVIFNYELVIAVFSYCDQWLGRRVYVFRLKICGYELDIIVESDHATSCLSFDILLGYEPTLIVKQPVGVSRPSDATHVHSIKSQIQLRQLTHTVAIDGLTLKMKPLRTQMSSKRLVRLLWSH